MTEMQSDGYRLDDSGVEHAADVLWATGSLHSWWPNNWRTWRELDPIGQDEFLAIVEQIVLAYLRNQGEKNPKP